MPNASLLAGVLLPDATSHPYGLFINGLDVLRQVGTAGNLYGAPLELIRVSERGPGQVSSMDFTVDDPSAVLSLVKGAEVQFWRTADSACLFRGYVDHWSIQPGFGGQGRTFQVSATGIEAWLDWLIVTSDFVASSSVNSQFTVTAALGTNGVFSAIVSNGSSSEIPYISAQGTQLSKTYPAGGTYRKLITDLQTDASTGYGFQNPLVPCDWLLTIDFLLNARAWNNLDQSTGLTLAQPTDYTTLTVTDSVVGVYTAANLRWDTEPDDLVHEVYIKGFDAASSGLFGDGTGVKGRQGYIDDATLTTYALALQRAQAFLASQSSSGSGSFDLETIAAPAATVHAGSLLSLSDGASGASGTYRIFGIDKTFTPTKETWSVTFGGQPRRASDMVRRLTRSTLY